MDLVAVEHLEQGFGPVFFRPVERPVLRAAERLQQIVLESGSGEPLARFVTEHVPELTTLQPAPFAASRTAGLGLP